MTNEAKLEQHTLALLTERGVSIPAIAELVLFLQAKFIPGLDEATAEESVRIVLRKREVQNAVMTGIALDKAAEAGSLEPPLQNIIAEDEGSMAWMRSWRLPSSTCTAPSALPTTATSTG